MQLRTAPSGPLIRGTNPGDTLVWNGTGWVAGSEPPATIRTATSGPLIRGTNPGDTLVWNGAGWVAGSEPAVALRAASSGALVRGTNPGDTLVWNGTDWVSSTASASFWSGLSQVASRGGFLSPLPEFAGRACPEQADDAALSISFAPLGVTGEFAIGAPVSLSCTLSGTFLAGVLTATGTVGGYTVQIAATISGDDLVGVATILAPGNTETRGFLLPPGGAPPPVTGTRWVDEVAGNDSNDGLTPATPLLTIAALLASGIANGDVLRLARGSRWREFLNTGGATRDFTISAYGIGPRPILDACDPTLAAEWTLVPATTAVYEASFTTVAGSGSAFSAIALANGSQLKPVADVATCEATPSSYVAVNPAAGGTFSMRVHLADGLAPADNEVEITTRSNGLYTRGSATITGLMCRSGWSASGSLYMDRSGDPIDNPLVDDCISLHGNDHNIYMCGGTLSRSVALGASGGTNPVTMFVFHRSSIDPTATMAMVDCAVINFPALDALITSISQKPQAFNSHADSGFWADQQMQRCGSSRTTGWAIRLGTVNECLFQNPRSNVPMVSQVTSLGSLQITNTRFLSLVATGTTGQAVQYGGTLLVENCYVTRIGDAVSGGHFFLNGTAIVRNCRFQADSAIDAVNDLSAALALTFERNVCFNRGPELGIAGSALTPSDFNAANGGSLWREEQAATARAFAVYQAANAFGNDVNSTAVLPTYEAEPDPALPVYLETPASLAARGYSCGPVQGEPGSGVEWVTPPTFEAWELFVTT